MPRAVPELERGVPDLDPLTYGWEEFDLGPAGDPNSPSGNAPIFRSFSPSTSNCRSFPQLSDLLNNTQTIGEILPSYGRTMNFRLTVRDNRSGGGGVNDDSTTVTASSVGGPFLVTAPNTAVNWAVDTGQNVTWNVAGTDLSPISSSAVDILLSTDGGTTYPLTLASGVPNVGSASITVPAAPTTSALDLYYAATVWAWTTPDGTSGSYHSDDLVFAVNAAVQCTIDDDCDDGLYCNGDEVCNAGTCDAGTPVVCDDGLYCNGTDTCNDATDSCDVGAPPACDDGLYCNGTETCNEGTDSCDAGTSVVCDDGAFCNGTETCNEGTDSCDPGTDPCAPLACDERADVCIGASNPTLWMSFRSNTAVPGVGTVADKDIVSYDEVTGTWALEFDGSDVGLGGLEISGLAVLPGGDLLLSFTAAGTVGGLTVDDSDIVRFTPTSMGSTTAGTFSWYFDGSDVALTSNGEDVDGIALAADGRLIVSTTGGFSGTGASGADEDLFLFTGTVGSSTTSGSFVRHFDGSDVGLGGNSAEEVDDAAFTDGGNLLFSTLGSFSVTGLSGADEDVVEFAGTFGTATSGTFSMRQDLTSLGIISNEDVGSLHVFE